MDTIDQNFREDVLMKLLMAPAAKIERMITLPLLTLDTAYLSEVDLEDLAGAGSVHAIAVLSNWRLMNKTYKEDHYGEIVGRGQRVYTTATTIEIPTSGSSPFVVTFDMFFTLSFAEREARSEETNWLFNGKSFPFAQKMEFPPTIWDYLYAVGCPLSLVEDHITRSDADVVRRARKAWLQKFS